MKTLALLFCMLSTVAYSHVDHAWNEDVLGYFSASADVPFIVDQKLKSSVNRIDMDFFRTNLSILTSSQFKRNKPEGLEVAGDFLKSEYEKLGFKVSFMQFGRGRNFIAEKKGTASPERVLILSSHIDSKNNQGANDNGTGTIGALAIARELSKNSYGATIRILGFDKEEKGMKGSRSYAKTLFNEDVIANINLEMMGVNNRQDGHFHVIDCGREDSVFITDKIRSSIQSLNLPITIVKACTKRSDHASFWKQKIPAVVISENFFGGDADPCYHKKCDVMDDRLNYPYMKNILEAVLDATEKLIQ